MELVKKTAEYKIYKRRDERFAVTTLKGKKVNGDEKAQALLAAELIKLPVAKAVEAAPVEEVAAEETATDAAEESAAE